MKYLSDGRKVVVISKVNNQETIVQEIFITEKGDEVASGEHFVVKSLHDEPVMSYQERKLKDVENATLKEIEQRDRYMLENRKAREELKGLKAIVASSKKLVELLPSQDLEVFAQFVTGTIEYLVVDDHDITPPVKMIDEIISYDNYYRESSFDSIKLVSILGRSEGKLDYRIHNYSDGSGSSFSVTPFTNKKDAIEHIKKKAMVLINSDRLSEKSYAVCIALGIEFSEEDTKKYKNEINSRVRNSIANVEKEIEKKQEQLSKYHGQLI